MNTDNDPSPFGEIVYSHTRSQAVADGFQVEVTKVSSEAGIKCPMFLTRDVFDNYVTVPEGVTGQDEAGRLWDLVWMTRMAVLRAPNGGERVLVQLHVRNDNGPPRLVILLAVCGPLDIDDPQPAFTLMMPDEN